MRHCTYTCDGMSPRGAVTWQPMSRWGQYTSRSSMMAAMGRSRCILPYNSALRSVGHVRLFFSHSCMHLRGCHHQWRFSATNHQSINNNKKQEINTYSAQKLWPHGARMGFRNTSWHTAQYRCRDIASLRTNCRCINQCVKFEILVILQRITKTFQKSINIT